MKMEQTPCSETSAIKHHTPGNNPKGYTQPTDIRFKFLTIKYSGASVHERPCSRIIRFTNKFSEQKTSRMKNGFSDYEHAS
jgi:hypothetical protein